MKNNKRVAKVYSMEGKEIIVNVRNPRKIRKFTSMIIDAHVWYRGLGAKGKLKFTILCLLGVCTISGFLITYQGVKIYSLKSELEKKERIINEELTKEAIVVKAETTENVVEEVVEPMIDVAVGSIENHDAVRLTADVLRFSGISYAPASNGKDHPELSKSVKRQVLADIEREYGRGPLVIFNPQDITQLSGKSVEDFEYILPEALKEIAPALKEAEDTYGINGFLIASIACLESSNGNSELAKEKNNLTGYNANDSYEGTSSFGSKFASKSESIIATAKLLSEKYAKEDGMWYSGKSIFDVNFNYCSVTTWAGKNLNRIEKFQRDLTERDNSLNQ